MSKTWRNILIIFAVVVVLCGALLLLLLLPGKETETPDDTTDTTDPSVTLVDVTGEDDTTPLIKRIHITSADYPAFDVVQAKDGSLVVDGYQGLLVNASLFDSVETALTKVTATKLIAENGDAATYGFDKPAATFTVTYYDGTTAALELGDEEPYGTGDYLRLADSNKVYLVDTTLGDSISLNPLAYIGTTLYADPELPTAQSSSQTVSAVLRDVTLTGSFYGKSRLSLRMVSDADSDEFLYTNYIITAPYVRCSNSDKLGNEFITVASLTAETAVVARYTDADLKKYGLDTPYLSAKLHTAARISTTNAEDNSSTTTYQNVEGHTVTLSKAPQDDYYYAIVDEYPSIYLISKAGLPWAEMTYADCVMSQLFLKEVKNVDEVRYTASGKTTVMALTQHPDEEDSDKSLTVKIGDKTMSTPNFRSLYQVMMGISRAAETTEVPSGTPDLRLQVACANGAKVDVSFYYLNASNYIVKNADGEVYLARASRVKNLIRQYERFMAGETVSTSE